MKSRSIREPLRCGLEKLLLLRFRVENSSYNEEIVKRTV